jgi:benzoyl-CoA reductase subunit D
MINIGIDIGARNVKIVLMKDGKVAAKDITQCGLEPKKNAEALLNKITSGNNISNKDIKNIIVTGSSVGEIQFSTGKISMVGAIAKAGVHFSPAVRTVIDVGAEDARASKCGDKGKLLDFVVNDRCAAGAGTFVEAMSRALEIKTEEMGSLSLKSDKSIPMNAQCVVFGESEVVSLIHQQTSKADIAKAVYDAMAERVSSMLYRLGINMDVALVGGVAKDIGFVNSLKNKLRLDDLLIPEDPEYAGAIGAALVAD